MLFSNQARHFGTESNISKPATMESDNNPPSFDFQISLTSGATQAKFSMVTLIPTIIWLFQTETISTCWKTWTHLVSSNIEMFWYCPAVVSLRDYSDLTDRRAGVHPVQIDTGVDVIVRHESSWFMLSIHQQWQRSRGDWLGGYNGHRFCWENKIFSCIWFTCYVQISMLPYFKKDISKLLLVFQDKKQLCLSTAKVLSPVLSGSSSQ